MAAKQKVNLWCGKLPNAFGYGILVLECTEEEARKSLKKAYAQWKKIYVFDKTFPQAMEYFGGTVLPVQTGKVYYDNLDE